MTIESDQEFREQCEFATAALTELATYLDEQEHEINPYETLCLFPVVTSYHMMIGASDNGDSGSDFRVDDELY
jgi:hypothetical protein